MTESQTKDLIESLKSINDSVTYMQSQREQSAIEKSEEVKTESNQDEVSPDMKQYIADRAKGTNTTAEKIPDGVSPEMRGYLEDRFKELDKNK